jgi:hypothetical protein
VTEICRCLLCVLIEFMLAENDKTYHVYGKLTTKQKSKMYFYLKLKYMMTHILNLMLMLILVNIMISYLKTIKNYTNTKKMVLNFIV